MAYLYIHVATIYAIYEVDGGQLREMFVFVFMCYVFLVFVSLV